MDNAVRITRMEALLTEALKPTLLNIIDESHLHAGHAGAREGKGHFRVQITSAAFDGMRMIQKHRLIYDSLGKMMQDDIHALSIELV